MKLPPIHPPTSQDDQQSVVSPVKRGRESAVWRQLYASFHREITSGSWVAGTRLPSSTDLAAHYGVNRHTIRRALSLLTQDGLIVTARGMGTQVARLKPFDIPLDGGSDYVAVMRAQGEKASSQIVVRDHIEAGHRYGALFYVPPTASLHRVEVLYSVGDQPFALSAYVAPRALIDRLDDALVRNGSIEKVMAGRSGRQTVRTWAHMGQCLASELQAKLLRVAPGQPLLDLEAVVRESDQIVAAERSVFIGRLVRFVAG